MPTRDTMTGGSPTRSIAGVGGTVVVLILCLLLASCGLHRVQPEPGYEAVLVEHPLIFGHGGVDATPVTTGSQWVAWTTQPIYVNTQPQQLNYEFNDLMSSNGIPLGFNASLRLRVTDSVGLINKFGPKWAENNVATEFASEVRQQVRSHDMNSLAISAEGIDQVDNAVTRNMGDYIKRTGLPLQLIAVTVGKASPPQEILNQRTETAAQDQRALTELSTKKAEDNRKQAETSRAEADNAYRQTLGLDPTEFVELQRIEMQNKVCSAQDAHCTFIIGNATPVVNGK